MELWAAVDLRGGSVVQLVGGDPAAERVRLPYPAAVARHWILEGFRRLHVVDLDAALGDGDNRAAVKAIARESAGRATLQLGGGLRSGWAVRRAFRRGADRVVVGTRAVEDGRWLERIARTWRGRVVVAADVRDGRLLTRGWTQTTARDPAGFVAALDALPLAAVLVTDVTREGREEGVDAELFAGLAAATRHPLIAAGGVSSEGDLAALAGAGVAGAVIGTALYTGRIGAVAALALEEADG